VRSRYRPAEDRLPHTHAAPPRSPPRGGRQSVTSQDSVRRFFCEYMFRGSSSSGSAGLQEEFSGPRAGGPHLGTNFISLWDARTALKFVMMGDGRDVPNRFSKVERACLCPRQGQRSPSVLYFLKANNCDAPFSTIIRFPKSCVTGQSTFRATLDSSFGASTSRHVLVATALQFVTALQLGLALISEHGSNTSATLSTSDIFALTTHVAKPAQQRSPTSKWTVHRCDRLIRLICSGPDVFRATQPDYFVVSCQKSARNGPNEDQVHVRG
jgi:hypothetical protein